MVRSHTVVAGETLSALASRFYGDAELDWLIASASGIAAADNPVERIDSYRNKRIFLVAGTSPDPLNWFDSVNETEVLAGQREFRARLSEAGIPHEFHEVPGGHVFRPDMFVLDLAGVIARLRSAALVSPSTYLPQR